MAGLWFLLVLVAYGNISSFRIAPFAALNDARSSWRIINKHAAHATLSLESADLTPAVDKYPRIPTNVVTQRLRLAAGSKPVGPDPFKLVAAELQPLSVYIKSLLVSENPVLTMAATHFFDKVT